MEVVATSKNGTVNSGDKTEAIKQAASFLQVLPAQVKIFEYFILNNIFVCSKLEL